MITKKDFFYLGIILIGITVSFLFYNQAKHQSTWCDMFIEEFRNGL